MFGKSRESGIGQQVDFSKLDKDALLAVYKDLQKSASHNIARRGQFKDEGVKAGFQDNAEAYFTKLASVRKVMDDRGIEAPTMEELNSQEKTE